jgi:hypothetical protein
MKKPKPRNKFANEADEQAHILDCLCWMEAERMEEDLGIPPEQGADEIKRLILSGRIVLDMREDGEAVRLVPGPSA